MTLLCICFADANFDFLATKMASREAERVKIEGTLNLQRFNNGLHVLKTKLLGTTFD